jgi:serine/threonine protein kinase
MDLKAGSLASLVHSGQPISDSEISTIVLHHMLQALDFLSNEGIIHRDLKPENILYSLQSEEFIFELADFGLCNYASLARTQVGTGLYLAPEMLRDAQQTTKIDVWSLFVTIIWASNFQGFRQRSREFKTYPEVLGAVQQAASHRDLRLIKQMADPDPALRASAAQILIECFDGDGLVSKRTKIPWPAAEMPSVPAPLKTPVHAERRRQQQTGNRGVRKTRARTHQKTASNASAANAAEKPPRSLFASGPMDLDVP